MHYPSNLPASAGVGFKPEHFEAITAARQPLGFFEVHAENYMGAGGLPHAQLAMLRAEYALSLHGVGLSIGSSGPLDRVHLSRLNQLCDRYQPHSFSEHLAWASHGGIFFNDLLPLPYTEATLSTVIAHVDEVQTALGRRMLLENPATYVRFAESSIPETAFLTEIARATGCGLCSTSIMCSFRRAIMAPTRAHISPKFRWSSLAKFISPATSKPWTMPARCFASTRMDRPSSMTFSLSSRA